MTDTTRRRRRGVVVLLLLALAAGAGWLAHRWATPAPTAFGWPADLTIVAGNGVRGAADGEAAAARFADPFALAVDAAGVAYVADAGRIRRIGRDGRVTTLPGRFDTPSGLAIDQAGGIIVAETGGNAIRRISPAGVVTTLAGDGVAGFRDGPGAQARFDGPMGVAVDAGGTVYVADAYNDRIRRIAADGRVTTLAGGAAPGFADGQGAAAAFDTPCGIVLGRGGVLLIADSGNDAIRTLGADGRVATLAHTTRDDGGLLTMPVGLAATRDGYLYVASFRRGRIVQIAPSGALRVLAGSGAADAGNAALRLASPAGLALDRAGALYVADPARFAVLKLAPRRGAVAQAPDLDAAPPALVRASNVPWPVAPQNGWHEVVGDMGEVRGDYHGESRDHIHAGLDIHAEVGAPVLAVANETVESPLPAWGLDELAEGLRVDALTYIHLRVGRTPAGAPIDPARFRLLRDAAGKLVGVRIKRGTRFRAGDVLGTDNRMAHVHLELGPPGGQVNPIVLRFPGLADHAAPHIEGVALFDAAGQRLIARERGRLVVPAGSGPLAIVVDAWDQVDGDAPRRRLGLYRAGFQILHADGTTAPGFAQSRIGIEFDRVPLDRAAAKILYAPSSGDAVHSEQPTRFLYVVSNHLLHGRAAVGGWRPAGLAPGDYIVRITAADHAGNVAQAGRDLPIVVR